MNAMLVGADTLGNIPGVLEDFGITIDRHISGRNSAHQRKIDHLPVGTELLILFTDFVGHNVMRHFRDLAAHHQIRCIMCRRSICALKQSLDAAGLQTRQCASCSSARCANKPKKRQR
ncbi:DUF2325 domain-containing protein [Neisseriaceae bacterium TC5R-5]|nr:DUF2325 domain-containing protein [Neisseriaceae bacterium TC5R-5]